MEAMNMFILHVLSIIYYDMHEPNITKKKLKKFNRLIAPMTLKKDNENDYKVIAGDGR